LLAISLSVVFLVLRPFLYPLILAVIAAIVCQPLHSRLLKIFRNRNWLASLATIILIIIFVLLPLTVIGWQIFLEGEQLYFSFSDNFGASDLSSLSQTVSGWFNDFLPILPDITFDLEQYLASGLDFLRQNMGSIFSNLAKIFTSLFVFIIAFFYLLKDGPKIKQAIIKFSPLTKEDDEKIITKIVTAINSVVKGSLLVALLQGASSSLGFVIFSVPNPILWGTLAALGALVPGLGTSVVLIPIILYLYFIGHIIASIGLLIWGVLAVGLIDNFLGPLLVGRKTQLHPLLVLLSVLGGLSFFGPIGFILGPLTIALLLVLLDIYSTIIVK